MVATLSHLTNDDSLLPNLQQVHSSSPNTFIEPPMPASIKTFIERPMAASHSPQAQISLATSNQRIESLTDLTNCLINSSATSDIACLDFISKNPLAASSSYTEEDLSLLMLSVKHSQTDSQFINKLIDLLAI